MFNVHESWLINDLIYTKFQYFTNDGHVVEYSVRECIKCIVECIMMYHGVLKIVSKSV